MASPWALLAAAFAILAYTVFYIARLNQLMKAVPIEMRQVMAPEWTPRQLRELYEKLEKKPFDYSDRIPQKLDRRYIITGASGLVGGHIVLHLLARGTSPNNIRILDIRKTERADMNTGLAAQVDFVKTDITSIESLRAAFLKPWDPTVADLPLTVFHSAAIIVPSERSKLLYDFPEKINVQGTKNVLDASREAGADIFSSTSSGSISIRPIQPFQSLWPTEPRDFWQFLDESDFDKPLRNHEEFFGNYGVTKAVAERLVCAENSDSFRTGCIRPTNAVYGHPSDTVIGNMLSRSIMQTWMPHIVQNMVHGANVANAHLYQEAALVKNGPQAGRPFIIIDQNPPISYDHMYTAVRTLSIHPFETNVLPPAPLLLLSHVVEWYNLLPYRFPFLKGVLPNIPDEPRRLQPALFNVCTHVVASDGEARKPVAEGGLGYKGMMTTVEGVVQEIMDWNKDHAGDDEKGTKKLYLSPLSYAERVQSDGRNGRS